jgi:hypothetical protein
MKTEAMKPLNGTIFAFAISRGDRVLTNSALDWGNSRAVVEATTHTKWCAGRFLQKQQPLSEDGNVQKVAPDVPKPKFLVLRRLTLPSL